jgi:hypothetical protein
MAEPTPPDKRKLVTVISLKKPVRDMSEGDLDRLAAYVAKKAAEAKA